MKIRRLQVEENQMAQIRVESRMARLSIDTRLRRIKQTEQQSAQMRVIRENPSIETDMEELRNNIGLKDTVTLTRDMTSRAASHMEQAIKTARRNSDYISSLPQSGNPIAQVERQNVLAVPRLPEAGGIIDPTVDIRCNPGSISIDWSIQDVTIIWDDYQSPVIRVEPKPSVNVELVQEQRLSFRVVEQSIPPEAGRMIDEEA
jgi:hypothetical protein